MTTGKNYKIDAELFQEIVSEMSRVTMEANVVDFLPLMKWFGFKNTENKLGLIQMKRDKFVQNIIEEHRRIELEEGSVKEKSIFQVLLDLQREEPEYYSDQTIRNLLLVLIHGATHTTSVTLEWAFSQLLENPDILRRAQADIDTLLGKERLFDESDVVELPYLRCIVNETLRLHPAAPLLSPHLSSDECTIGGFNVPCGTILLVNAWDIQNNPETWQDAEKFKPERWEGFEGGKNRLNLFPFGWGRRACPGENLAIRVVGLALGSLIQCFDWDKVGKIDMNEDTGIITPKVQPLIAKCNLRPFVFNLVNFEHK
ncbi:Cytochrome [Abeliophyllum distichum]|uniref:Cytochrome n=1 Tax=Abeliophyllum distichum TaxID=126358 RepID=A0ABD1TE32_9LAMI